MEKLIGWLLIEKVILFKIDKLKFVVVIMMFVFRVFLDLSNILFLVKYLILFVIIDVLFDVMFWKMLLLGIKVRCWCYGMYLGVKWVLML